MSRFLPPALYLSLFYFSTSTADAPVNPDSTKLLSGVKEDAPIAAVWWRSQQALRHGSRQQAKLRAPASTGLPQVTLLFVGLRDPSLTRDFLVTIATVYARHSVNRLVSWRRSYQSPGRLFVFVASNVTRWLASSVFVRQWLWIMIVGSFGTVLLRPYYLVVGVLTTLVAWLMDRNDLLWTPRFFSTEAFALVCHVGSLASIARAAHYCSKWARTAAVTAAIAITGLSMVAQVALVPHVYWAYLPRAASIYSPQERQQARCRVRTLPS